MNYSKTFAEFLLKVFYFVRAIACFCFSCHWLLQGWEETQRADLNWIYNLEPESRKPLDWSRAPQTSSLSNCFWSVERWEKNKLIFPCFTLKWVCGSSITGALGTIISAYKWKWPDNRYTWIRPEIKGFMILWKWVRKSHFKKSGRRKVKIILAKKCVFHIGFFISCF